MTHAIYVRDIGRTRVSAPRLLAYDIECRRTAESLITGIARAYPQYGSDPNSSMKWYCDADGLHELWVAAL